MDIKEIVLKLLAKEYPGMRQENQTFMVEFAEAIVAELAEQNEPVAWATKRITDGAILIDKEYSPPTAFWSESFPVFTFPPTAEQIANETAWQPIETAPKDGTRILLRGYGSVVVAGWGVVIGANVEGWCIVNDAWIHESDATHWMPLPKAPNGASS